MIRAQRIFHSDAFFYYRYNHYLSRQKKKKKKEKHTIMSSNQPIESCINTNKQKNVVRKPTILIARCKRIRYHPKKCKKQKNASSCTKRTKKNTKFVSSNRSGNVASRKGRCMVMRNNTSHAPPATRATVSARTRQPFNQHQTIAKEQISNDVNANVLPRPSKTLIVFIHTSLKIWQMKENCQHTECIRNHLGPLILKMLSCKISCVLCIVFCM